VSGGTGYMGRPLVERLLERGHTVRALVRPGSEHKLPPGAVAVTGDALDAASFAHAVAPADTLVHLVGVARPSPRKARQFRDVDLASARASVTAARAAGVRHLVYVSVAHPAPVMRAYIAARREAEALIRESGLDATVLRPWYVLGPGHRWPHVLAPLYALFERFPRTRAGARRLGLVTLPQMVAALVLAVEQPATGLRVVEVPEITSGGPCNT
jgi:uncharacterized protein YbjT (DUF2867 family)